MNKKLVLVAAIVAALVVVGLGSWFATGYIPLHRTVITVNDIKFNTADFIGWVEAAAVNKMATGIAPEVRIIANNAPKQLVLAELMRQSAAQVGVTVTDKEAGEILRTGRLPINAGSLLYVRAFLLLDKLMSDYFAVQVPESKPQVWVDAMLLESDYQAAEIRDLLINADDFTALAPDYALNYYSKSVNGGDFGWHPREVLLNMLGSDIPVDYAFSADVGSLSPPLWDVDIYKQTGYWLIRVLDEPSADQADVDALVLSSRALADQVRIQLENGENLATIADAYTQYSLSRETHGHIGVVDLAEMPQAFNDYVFSDNVVLGDWSQPILDSSLYTKGGFWLVKVRFRGDNKLLSSEDRNYLVGKLINDWAAGLESGAVVNFDGLSEELQELAVERATRFVQDY
jgi:hypothetical protein